jgi:hypothetical protein
MAVKFEKFFRKPSRQRQVYKPSRRGSGTFISHRVAARYFYKPSRRGSFFFLTSRRGSGSFSAAMDISDIHI